MASKRQIMTRLGTLVTSTVVAALVSVVPDASGQVRGALPRANQSVMPIAAALHGSVDGLVTDDAGTPVAGATVTVSSVGMMSSLAVSDQGGRFHLYGLTPGLYLLRAHFAGYIPSARRFVEVRPSARATVSVSLRRTDKTRLLAAGLGSTAGAGADAQANDDHSDVAWYLRHAKRSVLKDVTDREGVTGDDGKPVEENGPRPIGRSFAASGHANFFNSLPFSGQVDLLTASSFDTVERLFSSESVSRSVAALSVGGPVGAWGDWAIQGMTAQGDLGTWFLSGVLKSRAPGSHSYDLTIAYSAQRFNAPTSNEFLASGSDSSRAVGSFSALDRWQLSPQVALSYGTGYARYDYLVGPGLFSPRAELALKPSSHVHIRTAVSRQVLAPGAEEFIPSITSGVWVPSERTFDWLSKTPITAERANNYEVQIERDLGAGYAIAARTFYQEVSNQLVALFGNSDGTAMLPGTPYHVGPLGDVDAKGWSASLSSNVNRYLRGSITYQMTTANWVAMSDSGLAEVLAPAVLRPEATRVHDLTTSIETEVPRTSTRVFVLYKINSAFAKVGPEDAKPGLDSRFDVQVSQPLPLLDFTSAQWQVVFAVRNTFRQMTPGASIYDELLVVHPPKRVVGGLVVRF